MAVEKTEAEVEVEDLGDYDMDTERSAKVEIMIAEAETELDARVNFRWGKEQLDLVKRVARQMGVPYQTYIKQVVYRQCLADLKAAADVIDKSNA